MSILSLMLKPTPRYTDLSELWLSATQQPVDGGQEGSQGLGRFCLTSCVPGDTKRGWWCVSAAAARLTAIA